MIYITEEQANQIDRLRNAAKEHGSVADLLDAISGLDIDSISVDDDGREMLKVAYVASVFARADREVE